MPSGASTGEFEAVELRDGGDAWGGKGVAQAVANVNGEIAEALTGARAAEQGALDQTMIELDGTPNKGRLGANAILGVSLAVGQGGRGRRRPAALPLPRPSSTAAASRRVLPVPMMNVLNGGAHADNSVDFQEFMVVPAGAGELLRVPAGRHRGLPRAEEDASPSKGLSTAVGDEGGFAPDLESNEAALEASSTGVEAAGYEPGRRRLHRPRPGDQRALRGRRLRARARGPHPHARRRWPPTGRTPARRYPIVSIEDGMDEEDWDGWKLLTERLGDRVPAGRRRPLRHQPGAAAARHRAGRRQLDPGQGQPDRHPDRDARGDPDRPRGRLHGGDLPPLRARPRTRRSPTSPSPPAPARSRPARPSRSDRVAKYNRLLRIEEELGGAAEFPGLQAFAQRVRLVKECAGPAAKDRAWQRAPTPARHDASTGSSPPPRGPQAARGRARGASRIQWDRVGRIALTLVLAAVLYSYLNPAIDFVKTYTATTAAKAELHELQAENTRLHRRVQQPTTRSSSTPRRAARAWSRRRDAARRPRPAAAEPPSAGARRWLSAGSYLLSAAALAAVVALARLQRAIACADASSGLGRRPARLVEAILAVALLIWLGELLGTVELFYAGPSSLQPALAGAVAWSRRRLSRARLLRRVARIAGVEDGLRRRSARPQPRQDPPAGSVWCCWS